MAGGTNIVLSCGHCELGSDSTICSNTSSEEQYTLKVFPNGSLHLHCHSSVEIINFFATEDCMFPSVDHVEFLGCSLPSTSFGEILLQLGVYPKNITKMKFIGTGQVHERDLEDWHLQGLPNLALLEFRENFFAKFPADLLEATPKLKELRLISNDMSTIPESIFDRTPELATINLSNNNLASLPVDVFADLTGLKSVNLQNNALTEIRSEVFTSVPHLEVLDLSNNLLTNIQENLFKELRLMKELNLQGNKLKRLPGGVFSDMIKLETLNLNSNLLMDLEPGSFDNLRRMKILNIGNNSLTDLPDKIFQKCQSLQTLILNHNQLATLKWTSFPGKYSSLTYLDLGNNNISYFQLDNQVMLKKLFLNDNRFDSIPEPFTRIFVHLEMVDLSGNFINYVDLNSLHFMHETVTLDLRRNNVKVIDLSFFWAGYSFKKVVELYLEGNDLLCNCILYRFASIAQGKTFKEVDTFEIIVKDVDKVACRHTDGKVQKILDVDVKMLTCKTPCDNCICFWRSYDEMVIIDCSYQELEQIPVLNMSAYRYSEDYSITLNLRNNSITDLDGLQDPNYVRLVNLTIPNNKLSFINESHLPENLKVLDVHGNNLTSLSDSTLEYMNATDMHLSLGSNPWTCNCDLIYFLNFLHVPSRKVDDFSDIKCKDDDEPLMTMSEHSLCPFFMQPMVIVTIVAILIFLILFAVLGTVSFYKYKQGIKVWLFTHRMCLWAITEDEMDADKKYDAFISYSHKDEDFVNKVLVPGLESGDPRYRICLHYRDWIPGEYIQNQILQSVEASRRTIVVLSSNFIESVWGQLEFKAAHSQALQDRTNRIIIIVYGEIPPESELDEKLQLYISMKTYVKWGDTKFWEKLRYIMPHSQDLILKKHRKRRDTDKLELCKSDSKQSV